MNNTPLAAVLDLFFSQGAHESSDASKNKLSTLSKAIDIATLALNKINFINNIERELKSYQLSSVQFGYEYESDDEGGSYASYYVLSATHIDGQEYKDVGNIDSYSLKASLGLDLLPDYLVQSLVDNGVIGVSNIGDITNFLISSEDKQNLDYLKIKSEHQLLGQTTPRANTNNPNNPTEPHFKV